MHINDNDDLASLSLPALAGNATQNYIRSNHHLPSCQATAIRDQVVLSGGATFGVTANLADGCL